MKQPSEGFFKKDVLRNFAKFTRKYLRQNLFFGVFLSNFVAFLRTPFLQNSTRRLILIITVSKRVLANETVNYDTETKAYVLI